MAKLLHAWVWWRSRGRRWRRWKRWRVGTCNIIDVMVGKLRPGRGKTRHAR